MGSTLEPVPADIFMIELEKSLVPELTSYVKYWKKYMDVKKIEHLEYILSVLNGFDNNTEFTLQE